jgi:hypothetical protein
MKKLIIFINILFANAVIAQTNATEAELAKQRAGMYKSYLKEGKEKAHYIFEGKVISAWEEYSSDKEWIYLHQTIRVYQTFKGDIKDTIVDFITALQDGEIPYNNEKFALRELLSASTYSYLIGKHSILYCVDPMGQLKLVNNDKSKLHLVSWRVTEIVFHEMTNENYASYGFAKFANDKELSDGIGFFLNRNIIYNPTFAKIASVKEIEKIIKLKNAFLIDAKNKQAATSITYSFQNAFLSGTTQKFYEFDVSAYASQSGTYLEGAIIKIQYNTSAFGSSVVANSNLTVSSVASFPTSNYPVLSKTDNNSNIFGITIFANLSSPNRLILPTTLTPLFHVRMAVTCSQNVGLSFVSTASLINAYYAASATTQNATAFSPINANDVDNTTACALSITNFFPTQLNGGRGDVLTITGNNFGNNIGSGFVQLKNANDGGASYIRLDNDDIKSWSNSQIQVVIPSFSRGQGTVGVGAPVGNGPIVVSDGISTFTTATNLTVFYSQKNYSETAQPLPNGFSYRKQRIYLTGNNPNQSYSNKFPILIDSTSCAPFNSGCGALATIKKSIKDWVCETKIPFKHLRDTLFPNQIPNNLQANNVLLGYSTIRFSDFSQATVQPIPNNVIAVTYLKYRRCDTLGGGRIVGYLPEFEIEFNKNVTWWCDTNIFANKPANAFDFYEVAQHELGHANLLAHNNDQTSIMFWESLFSPAVNSGFRRIFINIMDYLGGQQVVNEGKNTGYQGNCTYVAVSPDYKCTGTSGIKHLYFDEAQIDVRPNPFTENLIIEFESKLATDISISIYNTVGQRVKLFDEIHNSIGKNKFEYNGEELKSGVYFIRFNIGGETTTRKIIKQ